MDDNVDLRVVYLVREGHNFYGAELFLERIFLNCT
jgi:hypothetical protein